MALNEAIEYQIPQAIVINELLLRYGRDGGRGGMEVCNRVRTEDLLALS